MPDAILFYSEQLEATISRVATGAARIVVDVVRDALLMHQAFAGIAAAQPFRAAQLLEGGQ